MINKMKVLRKIGFNFLFFCLLCAPNLHASTGPLETLENNVSQVLEVLKSHEFDTLSKNEKDVKILSKVSFMFDFASFSRGALGANWRRFSPEQQDEFTKLFTRLIARAYLTQLDNQSIKDFKVTYLHAYDLKATKSGIKRSDVFTEVLFNGAKTPVDYRMFYKNDAWKIYDVKIEGVSMVANYRKQYQQRFMDSPDEMIEELQDKLQNM